MYKSSIRLKEAVDLAVKFLTFKRHNSTKIELIKYSIFYCYSLDI